MREQPLQAVVAGGDVHFRQRGAQAFDPFGGRLHLGLAADHRGAVLIDAGAVQCQALAGFIARGHGDADAQPVTDAYGREELERLRKVNGACAGQAVAQHRGNQRPAQHAVRDDALKAGGGGEVGVQMLRVDVARENGKQLDILFAERALNGVGVPHGNFVEGAVAHGGQLLRRCAGGRGGLWDIGHGTPEGDKAGGHHAARVQRRQARQPPSVTAPWRHFPPGVPASGPALPPQPWQRRAPKRPEQLCF